MTPHLSIAIPLYNKQKHVERAINGLLSQTVTDWECWVVDDGSTDASAALVEKMADPRIHLIRQKNAGAAVARNNAVRAGSAPIVALLDADDYWSPNHLEELLLLHEKFPAASIWCTHYQFESEKGRLNPVWAHLPEEHHGLVPNYFQSALDGDPLATSSSALIRRAAFELVGGFDPEERTYQDSSLWAKMMATGTMAYSKATTAFYCLDAENMLTAPRAIEEPVKFIKNLEDIRENNQLPDRFKEPIDLLIASNLLGHAGTNVLAGAPQLARKFLADPRTKAFGNRRLFWRLMSFLPTPVAKKLFAWNQNRKRRRT